VLFRSKETMQIVLPVRQVQAALREASLTADGHERQIALLKAFTSRDFNRCVWNQILQIPEMAFLVLPHLDTRDAPVSTLKETPTGRMVVLGDERFGARIELVTDKENWVVDRIWIIAGAHAEPKELKLALKEQLAKRGAKGLAFDPMSAHPIETDAPATKDATTRNSNDPSDTNPSFGAPRVNSDRGVRPIPTDPNADSGGSAEQTSAELPPGMSGRAAKGAMAVRGNPSAGGVVNAVHNTDGLAASGADAQPAIRSFARPTIPTVETTTLPPSRPKSATGTSSDGPSDW
jgi:hypothetical protein